MEVEVESHFQQAKENDKRTLNLKVETLTRCNEQTAECYPQVRVRVRVEGAKLKGDLHDGMTPENLVSARDSRIRSQSQRDNRRRRAAAAARRRRELRPLR